MTEILPFGPAALSVIFIYILSLIGIGWVGYRAREDNSMKDFYLAGRGFGFLVLLLTLYATQYSGNTLFGFTGKAYRIGFSWVMSLHFMTAIVACYLIFAPKLYHHAKQKGYITPVDFLEDRFRSSAISLIAAFVMIAALINYALAQLMAMGRAFQGLVSINPVQAYICGVIFLAIIMGIYETLGGLRAVAWTDVIQGSVLMCGFAVMLLLVFTRYGTIGIATEQIFRNADPEIVKKAMPPDWQRIREWLSYILVVGLGGALYPQAIQRIYAARSATVLRRSLTVMAFFPLTTTLVALIVGVMAIAHHPGLKGAQADQILMVICRQVQSGSTFGYWLVVILFAAVLAAIMSTADSALLTISSIFTKDLYARFIKHQLPEEELTKIGKLISWIVIGVLVGLAILLQENTTLVKLLDRKFDMLVQLAPAFMIGINWRGLQTKPVLVGLSVGLVVSICLALLGYGKISGIHAGIFGLGLNLLISVGGSVISK